MVSKVTKVSSMEQHLGVTLWVWAHNLHICTKHIYSVCPGLLPAALICSLTLVAMLEIRSLKLFN